MSDPVIQPSSPLLSNIIGINWVAEHSDVEVFCGRYQAIGPVSGALGTSEHVHLVILASELVEERELVGAPEGRDSLKELPLQAIYRRECQVTKLPLQIVLNPLRLP